MQEKLLTPDDVAEVLNVSSVAVRGWLRDGKLKGLKLAGNMWRVRREDFDLFIERASFNADEKGKIVGVKVFTKWGEGCKFIYTPESDFRFDEGGCIVIELDDDDIKHLRKGG